MANFSCSDLLTSKETCRKRRRVGRRTEDGGAGCRRRRQDGGEGVSNRGASRVLYYSELLVQRKLVSAMRLARFVACVWCGGEARLLWFSGRERGARVQWSKKSGPPETTQDDDGNKRAPAKEPSRRATLLTSVERSRGRNRGLRQTPVWNAV